MSQKIAPPQDHSVYERQRLAPTILVHRAARSDPQAGRPLPRSGPRARREEHQLAELRRRIDDVHLLADGRPDPAQIHLRRSGHRHCGRVRAGPRPTFERHPGQLLGRPRACHLLPAARRLTESSKSARAGARVRGGGARSGPWIGIPRCPASRTRDGHRARARRILRTWNASPASRRAR